MEETSSTQHPTILHIPHWIQIDGEKEKIRVTFEKEHSDATEVSPQSYFSIVDILKRWSSKNCAFVQHSICLRYGSVHYINSDIKWWAHYSLSGCTQHSVPACRRTWQGCCPLRGQAAPWVRINTAQECEYQKARLNCLVWIWSKNIKSRSKYCIVEDCQSDFLVWVTLTGWEVQCLEQSTIQAKSLERSWLRCIKKNISFDLLFCFFPCVFWLVV